MTAAQEYAALREFEHERERRRALGLPAPASNWRSPAAAGSPQAAFDLQRSAGNQVVDREARAAGDSPEPPLLAKMRRAVDDLDLQIEMSKDKRDDQKRINDDQRLVSGASEVVGGFLDSFGGKGLHVLHMPDNTIWEPSKWLVSKVYEKLAARDPIGAARALQELAGVFRQAQTELNEYLQELNGGADAAITGLRVAEVAGAIAATVLSGGAAGGGLLATSLAAAGGAGAYGMAQELATQSGEQLADTRKNFDFKAVLLRGGTDALTTFVGALAGGALSRWAIARFGKHLLSRLTPFQRAMLAERIGIVTEDLALVPEILVTRGQKLFVEFFSGVATTPLTVSVSAVLKRLQGQAAPDSEEFTSQVIEEAIKGGLIQLFLGWLLHGKSAPQLELSRGRQPTRPVSHNERAPEIDVTRPSGLELDTGPAPTRESTPHAEFEPTIDLSQPSPLELDTGPAPTRESTPHAEFEPTIDLSQPSPLELDTGPAPTRESTPRTEFEPTIDLSGQRPLKLDRRPAPTREGAPHSEFAPEVDLSKKTGIPIAKSEKRREEVRRMRPKKPEFKGGEASGEVTGSEYRKGGPAYVPERTKLLDGKRVRSPAGRSSAPAYHEFTVAEMSPGQLRSKVDPKTGQVLEVKFRVTREALANRQSTDRSFKADRSIEAPQSPEVFRPKNPKQKGVPRELDRGHMATRRSQVTSPEAEVDADLMTNVLPMARRTNQQGGEWFEAEVRADRLALEHGDVEVTVTPNYDANPPITEEGVPIPNSFQRKVTTLDGRVLEDATYQNL